MMLSTLIQIDPAEPNVKHEWRVAHELVVSQNKSIEYAAKQLGVSKTSVRRYLDKYDEVVR